MAQTLGYVVTDEDKLHCATRLQDVLASSQTQRIRARNDPAPLHAEPVRARPAGGTP